ncbi:MAG: hydantoinase B/oxoprolinase family protein [Thermoplasmata archaeon]|uniref:hydantoinase B/oxoprolinase family protein n=1 Tax=Caldisericum sp. TaxID=2499687 RepID=UPI0019E15A95|nr:hydantoinase B/oxoprolinase family protein [Thermoplasmatales archaeon]
MLDLFTLEIIKNGLVVANEEMFQAFARTAKSPVIYEVLDFAVGITDANGNLVAQAPGVPAFSGVLDFAAREVIEKWKNELKPGDIIVSNVPYDSGTHLNDVTLALPVFSKDDMIAMVLNKGHWSEVGGMAFGSWNPNSTEIYQEGIMLPCVKLYSEGKPNKDVIDIIMENSRLPDYTLGDMEAQAASMKVASRRIIKLVEKYGVDNVKLAMEKLLEDGEKLSIFKLKSLPKGEFEAEDYIDAAIANTEKPVYVKARVKITDEEFIVDFTGSEKQVMSPINSPFPATVSGVRETYMAITDPHAYPNGGFFKPLKVKAEKGSVFYPVKPAPTSTDWEAIAFATELVWKALAPHIPEKLPAGHFLSIVATIVGGINDRTGEPFAIVEPQPGGWGASSNSDGTSCLVACGDGETYIASSEVYEKNFPIMVERYMLNTETGVGAGKYRGGFGVIREYRILNSQALVTIQVGRHDYPPWGLKGGLPGPGNKVFIYKDGKNKGEIRRISADVFRKGDLISILTSGGGGYGNPLERDPKLVLEDYMNGLISVSDALNIYGVVIEDKNVNIEKTELIRRKMRA